MNRVDRMKQSWHIYGKTWFQTAVSYYIYIMSPNENIPIWRQNSEEIICTKIIFYKCILRILNWIPVNKIGCRWYNKCFGGASCFVLIHPTQSKNYNLFHVIGSALKTDLNILFILTGKAFSKPTVVCPVTIQCPKFSKNSTGADGGPRSRVCAHLTLRSAPHWHQ